MNVDRCHCRILTVRIITFDRQDAWTGRLGSLIKFSAGKSIATWKENLDKLKGIADKIRISSPFSGECMWGLLSIQSCWIGQDARRPWAVFGTFPRPIATITHRTSAHKTGQICWLPQYCWKDTATGIRRLPNLRRPAEDYYYFTHKWWGQ